MILLKLLFFGLSAFVLYGMIFRYGRSQTVHFSKVHFGERIDLR